MIGVERDGFYVYRPVGRDTWTVEREGRPIGHIGRKGRYWWYRPAGEVVDRIGLKTRADAVLALWLKENQ